MTHGYTVYEKAHCNVCGGPVAGRLSRCTSHSRRVPYHGTDNEYVNGGCRCDECRRAHSVAPLQRAMTKAELDQRISAWEKNRNDD